MDGSCGGVPALLGAWPPTDASAPASRRAVNTPQNEPWSLPMNALRVIPPAGAERFWRVFLALLPAPAVANAGVGFFTLPWPVVILALIPVIGLEGCVLAWMLRRP